MPETIVCGVCRAVFHASPSHRRKYCNRTCAAIGRTKKTENLQAKYRVRVVKEHPLLGAGTSVLEHRSILWDHIGRGPHKCHRCSTDVSWFPDEDPGCKPLVIDHVDRNSKNNSLDNLAVSCQRCNLMNSPRTVEDDEVFITLPVGTRLRAIELVCPVCETTFLRRKNIDLSVPRYCTPECMYQRNL